MVVKEKTEKELRKISYVALGMFGVLSSFFFWKGSLITASFFTILFLALGVMPLVFKRAGGIVLKKWLVFTGIIGEIINRLMLALVYFVVILPIGIVMKVIGRDRLKIKKLSNSKTYWVNLESIPNEIEHLKRVYTRQF